jgi:hypothetical protein
VLLVVLEVPVEVVFVFGAVVFEVVFVLDVVFVVPDVVFVC